MQSTESVGMCKSIVGFAVSFVDESWEPEDGFYLMCRPALLCLKRVWDILFLKDDLWSCNICYFPGGRLKARYSLNSSVSSIQCEKSPEVGGIANHHPVFLLYLDLCKSVCLRKYANQSKPLESILHHWYPPMKRFTRIKRNKAEDTFALAICNL